MPFFLLATAAFARTEFWAPAVPPRAHYTIDIRYSAEKLRLEGTETIRFRNDTARPIGRIALQSYGDLLAVRANGVVAKRAPGKHSIALFDLPHDVQAGSDLELKIEFGDNGELDSQTASAVTSFVSPHLWWGFGTLDEYEVRVQVPEGYAVATSGRYDAATGIYRAENARAFGLFLGKGYQSAEADAGDVRVRAVFTEAGRPCAELLLKSAVDAINFYRERFGSYPQRSLSIVPGGDQPVGGYPVATALVVIHGEQRMAERPQGHWRWITAHEVGHMYWGDSVLAQGPGSLSWLMIGLGLHADREYRLTRKLPTVFGNLEANYLSGVNQGRDTTMDVTSEQEDAIDWDFNNIVVHGKSAALINALESVLGAETFDHLYLRCLKEYRGHQLGWREFQRIAELESGQDLGWFFEPWVRSSGSAMYRVAGKQCSPRDREFDCRIQVERTGDMRMPVTVEARFEDGSRQRARTERLADLDELQFHALSPIQVVTIEPDAAITLIAAPATSRKVLAAIRDLPWTGAGPQALEFYRQLRELRIEDPMMLWKLALALYDSKNYHEALDLLGRIDKTEFRFPALVWQGHLLDLLGRRPEAIARYQEALKIPGSPTMRHDQYNLKIDKHWVEERLKTPFERH